MNINDWTKYFINKSTTFAMSRVTAFTVGLDESVRSVYLFAPSTAVSAQGINLSIRCEGRWLNSVWDAPVLRSASLTCSARALHNIQIIFFNSLTNGTILRFKCHLKF